MIPYRKVLSETEKETAMNVFKTWEVSLQQLLNTDPFGHQRADIRTMPAFLDSKGVSEDLFRTFSEGKARLLKDKQPGGSLKALLDAKGHWKSSSFVDRRGYAMPTPCNESPGTLFNRQVCVFRGRD